METENNTKKREFNARDIASAIVIAGVLIAGAILLKGNTPASNPQGANNAFGEISPITKDELFLGDKNAKVAVVIYEDFQCPFCAAVTGLQGDNEVTKYLKERDPSWTPFIAGIKADFVNTGKVQLIYRNYPFLGPESIQTYEASLCAKDQGKYFEYHDYLFANHKGENQGDFSDENLKMFAGKLGLDQATFDSCLTSDKYAEAAIKSKDDATKSGVTGTPKGFILKNGKVVDTIDGAISYTTAKTKLENVLK